MEIKIQVLAELEVKYDLCTFIAVDGAEELIRFMLDQETRLSKSRSLVASHGEMFPDFETLTV